jgi:hypothetical protein
MSIPEGAKFVVSGWGTTSESGPLSDTLRYNVHVFDSSFVWHRNSSKLLLLNRQVEIPYVNDNYCSMAYGQIFFGDVMMCAGEGTMFGSTNFVH